MANRKRAVPLTPAQKRERNRLYQAKQRHKTNNRYQRAYRRASQRAVKYVQRYHNSIWIQYLEEELAKDTEQPYKHAEKTFDGKATKATKGPCQHDGDVFVMGVAIGCAICGHSLGTQQLTGAQREVIAELIGAVIPDHQVKA